MSKIIMVTSGKGGVGKTTVSATLGALLSQKKNKVLLVDGDMGMRDLDLALGVQDEVLFTAYDLMGKQCFKEDALVTLDQELDFLSASQKFRWEDVKRKAFPKLLKKLSPSYDYVIIDAPAGIGRGSETILRSCHEVLLIIEPSRLSLRDGLRVLSLLRENKIKDYKIIINKVPLNPNKGHIAISEISQAIGEESIIALLPESDDIRYRTNEGLLQEVEEDTFYYKMLQHILYNSISLGDNQLSLEDMERIFREEAKESYPHNNTVQRRTQGGESSFADRRRGNLWKWSQRRR